MVTNEESNKTCFIIEQNSIKIRKLVAKYSAGSVSLQLGRYSTRAQLDARKNAILNQASIFQEKKNENMLNNSAKFIVNLKDQAIRKVTAYIHSLFKHT